MSQSAECSYNIIMATEVIGLSHMEREILAKKPGFFSVPAIFVSPPYLVSLWTVCFRQKRQYFFISSLSGSFFLFFLVL